MAGALKTCKIPPEIGEQIWADIEYFANYGFNKAHSADYALVTCQTAWLKAHYPVEYMTALLSVARVDTENIIAYTGECARLKIDVRPPALNLSDLDFTVETEDSVHAGWYGGRRKIGGNDHPSSVVGRPSAIRFGLGAIKNVGDGVVNLIVEERKAKGSYRSLEDFCDRVDLRQMNKRALECLVKCGVFDEFGRREQILVVMDRMLESSQRAHHAQTSHWATGSG